MNQQTKTNPFTIVYFVLLLILTAEIQASEKLNIIFDIDYTITHEVSSSTPGAIKLNYDNKYYRVNDWVIEGIENLVHRSNANIYFFSGGNKIRNNELLTKLKLSSNKSLKEISQGVYSKSDLEKVSNSGSFGERYKKNLRKLGFDLEKTVLIDDYKDFVPKYQAKNMLWLGKSYHYFETMEQAKLALKNGNFQSKYIPNTQEQLFISKNKMKFIFELLLDSLEEKSPKNSLNFINREKNNYIPYNEYLDNAFKRIFGPLSQKPNMCFHVFKVFKIN